MEKKEPTLADKQEKMDTLTSAMKAAAENAESTEAAALIAKLKQQTQLMPAA